MTIEENSASAGAPASDAHPSCPDGSSCPSPAAAPAAAGFPGSAAPPGSAHAPAPEVAVQDSARCAAPPSGADGPDPFNIVNLKNRHWDRPVFDQECVGAHVNDLLIFYSILSDYFHECLLKTNPNEAFSPRWRNQTNFCYRLLDYRTILFNILKNYQANVTLSLEKVKKELQQDQVSLNKLGNSPLNNAELLGEPTPGEVFAALEDNLRIYTLLTELEDGMANHLMGIMNKQKPGFLLNRENVRYFLRDSRFN
jgi:hypothetical protein